MDNPSKPIYISYHGNVAGIPTFKFVENNGQWVQYIYSVDALIQGTFTPNI